ncbi:MAG: NAD(P)H-hydrate dehydratase [Saprospiraceae bacterium]|nr:NAD(P)H-hydrate dehydratase [Saprospiraceae bacterium]
MYLYSKNELKEWDQYTMRHEPVSSISLMKRAADRLTDHLFRWIPAGSNVLVLCGSGNNGGDGFCIAKNLRDLFYHVEVWFFPVSNQSEENSFYFDQLKNIEEITLTTIDPGKNLPEVPKSTFLIDAIMGYGFKGPWKNGWDKIILDINTLSNTKIAIDLPSGLNDDEILTNVSIIADHTLTIEVPKKCFFYPENVLKTGEWTIVPIGLHPEFRKSQKSQVVFTDKTLISFLLKKRHNFDDKWSFGHVALFAGSDDFPGAALLASRACIRSGAGLTTCFTSSFTGQCLIPFAPEVMWQHWDWSEGDKKLVLPPSFSALAVGPGIGRHKTKESVLFQLLQNNPQIHKVIDADALNMMASADVDFSNLCGHSILTPHAKEFDRLFGAHSNLYEREQTALSKAKEWNCIIILKGHYSRICTPQGKMYINSTGNPGMAKGGSGDVLTGILVGLLSQKYSPEEAAVIGTYIHGLAGDFAAEKHGQVSMLPTDLIENIGSVFKQLIP